MNKSDQWKALTAPLWRELAEKRSEIRDRAKTMEERDMECFDDIVTEAVRQSSEPFLRKLLALRELRRSGVDPVMYKLQQMPEVPEVQKGLTLATGAVITWPYIPLRSLSIARIQTTQSKRPGKGTL